MLNKLDMVPQDERAARVKDFVKRFKWKGPVFEISALTREGCETLIREIYQHIHRAQVAEQPPAEVDPRFVELPDDFDPRFAELPDEAAEQKPAKRPAARRPRRKPEAK